MEPLQLIGYLIEGITIIAGSTSVYLIIKKNRAYFGNVMMASSIACITLYMLCITIYDIFLPITHEDVLVYIFLPLAIWAIVGAGMFMFFTMMVMIKGEHWVKDIKKIIWFILPVIAFGIFILVKGSDLIEINDYEFVDTSTSLIVLILMGVLLLFFIGRQIMFCVS